MDLCSKELYYAKRSRYVNKACASRPSNYNNAVIEFITTPGLTHYDAAIAEMESRVAAIRAGTKPEAIWLVEHPPLYTAGTSAKASDLLSAQFPVYQTGRGGQHTYHGPGQRVSYVMIDLAARGGDIRHYVWSLEEWIIRTLAEFAITGERREGRIGIWVVQPDGCEEKIAAIGVRVRSGVTYHGISVNVNPDLAHFSGIVPCGIAEHGVTSFHALEKNISMSALDETLKKTWPLIF